MFEDFTGKRSGGARLVVSIVAAVLAFCSAGAALVYASSKNHAAPPPEPSVDVTFAETPIEDEPEELEVEEIETPVELSAQPRVRRPKMVMPTEIPDEVAKESDAELKDTKDTGPVGGSLRGRAPVKRAKPTPPPPKPPKRKASNKGPIRMPERATPPKQIAGPRAPNYPKAAKKAAKQGVVIVKLIVSKTGKVSRFEIVRGDKVFHDAVRQWIRLVRYSPAKLPDGTPFATYKLIRLPFRLTNI